MKKFNKEEELLNFIRNHQEEYGYPPTVREMCRAIKVSSTSTISYYLSKLENGGLIKKSPNKNRALEVVGDTIANFSNYVRIPIVGKITAGEPILAVENTEEYFLASPNMFRGEGLFVLTVSGESMINAGIYDGDKIIIKQQSSVNNGEIAACLIDGCATVKRFYKEDGVYRLQPENDTMDPIYTTTCEILGKVIGLIRKF
ncbi:MAG: transcriptional repressor LexA [Clostridia bacterium]|jgi:repressor LexA|nr:transcriptional repressor LexA [Clostridia bacterium]